MGGVFAARGPGSPELVAIKIIKGSVRKGKRYAERFGRECAYQHFLKDYKDIVRSIDHGKTDEGRCYLVMELVLGHTLNVELGAPVSPRTELNRVRAGPLEPRRAGSLLRRLAGAVGRMHHHQLIHRDIKPENIFVLQTPRGERIKIGDLGLAWLMPKAGPEESVYPTVLRRPGDVPAGSPPYMAPEQVLCDETQTPAMDIYSLGVVAYEMFTGRLPYTITPEISRRELMVCGIDISVARYGAFDASWLKAHVFAELVPAAQANPDLPPGVCAMLDRCIARRPEDRFQSVDELLHQLDAVQTELNRRGPTPHTARRAPPPGADEQPRTVSGELAGDPPRLADAGPRSSAPGGRRQGYSAWLVLVLLLLVGAAAFVLGRLL